MALRGRQTLREHIECSPSLSKNHFSRRRDCRGEHCSPAWPYAAAKRYGSIWNAPLRRRGGFYIRPGSWSVRQSITGAHCAPLQEFFNGLNRCQQTAVQFVKNHFSRRRDCRGEHCSPAAISGNVRFHGSIWNAPLRRRGGFYIRPCNLGQRKTSRASTARPYNALFRQSDGRILYPPNSPVGKVKRQIPLAYLCLM